MRALVTWISRCVRAGPGTNGNEWDDEETTIVVVLDQFKNIFSSNRGTASLAVPKTLFQLEVHDVGVCSCERVRLRI